MSLEPACNATIRRLLEIRKNVTDTLQTYSEELIHIKNTESVSSEDIVDFSDYISRGLSAPNKWLPGNPLVGGHPPAPQPEQMRIGMLGQYNLEHVNVVNQALVPQEELHIEQPESMDEVDDFMHMPNQSSEKNGTEPLENNSPEMDSVFAVTSENKLEIDSSRFLADKYSSNGPNKKARVISINFDLSSESENEEEEKDKDAS